MTHADRLPGSTRLGLALTTFIMIASGLGPAEAQRKPKFPEVSHDGLVLVPKSEFAVAYVHPDADWSGYRRIQLLDAQVAFRRNWLNDQRASLKRPTVRDMERIKKDLAELLHEVFRDELQRDGTWPLVDSAAEDVLLVRPAIVDLDVNAPDTSTIGRTYTFAASAGSATLMLEAYDSVTGEILARVLDREDANRFDNVVRFSNRSTNAAAARRALTVWAKLLGERLDEVCRNGVP